MLNADEFETNVELAQTLSQSIKQAHDTLNVRYILFLSHSDKNNLFGKYS